MNNLAKCATPRKTGGKSRCLVRHTKGETCVNRPAEGHMIGSETTVARVSKRCRHRPEVKSRRIGIEGKGN
jgi:hypothetical protein